MSNDFIATDHPLTAAEQRTLVALLDTMLPASDDGSLPSAGQIDLIGYLLEKAEEKSGENENDFIPVVVEIVGNFDEAFSDLPLADRYPLVEAFSTAQAELFGDLLYQVYECYYQDDRVLEGIGMMAGAPFPRGNTIESGDLSLLDPVLANSYTYRK